MQGCGENDQPKAADEGLRGALSEAAFRCSVQPAAEAVAVPASAAHHSPAGLTA